MNKYAFLTEPARRGTELLEGSEGARNGFSLIIRTDDGSTMLKADVDYMHQAFQKLIDWSVDEVDRDVCAVITGPNGFHTNHRIKASQDFDWIESAQT
jgi:predicted metallo-beta-lactamase superfamily hydrolase